MIDGVTKKSIDEIFEQRNDRDYYARPAGILAVTFFLTLLAFLATRSPELPLPLKEEFGLLFGIISIITLGATFVLAFLSRRHRLSIRQSSILDAYWARTRLDDYLHKGRKNNDLKKAKQHLKDLRIDVTMFGDEFEKDSVISLHSANQKQFYEKIKKLTVDKEKIPAIILFLDKFMEFSFDPEMKFDQVNLLLNKAIPKSDSDSDMLSFVNFSEFKATMKKHATTLKLIWVSPVTGIILFLIFNYADSTQLHSSLTSAVGIATVAFFGILFRNKIPFPR